jgi:SAM-dependent methyltransferase
MPGPVATHDTAHDDKRTRRVSPGGHAMVRASQVPGRGEEPVPGWTGLMARPVRGRAEEPGVDVTLCVADAQALPFPDACFDTVVCTLGLSSIPDDHAAVLQMYRVLRPGGRLLLLGHVAGRHWPVRVAQLVVQRYSQRLTGDRQLRQTLPLVEAAGFHVDRRTLRRAGVIELLAASKPAHQAG